MTVGDLRSSVSGDSRSAGQNSKATHFLIHLIKYHHIHALKAFFLSQDSLFDPAVLLGNFALTHVKLK